MINSAYFTEGSIEGRLVNRDLGALVWLELESSDVAGEPASRWAEMEARLGCRLYQR